MDVDGDTLTATLVSLPSNGSVTLNGDGSFDYTPNADFFGADSFTYTVSDGSDASSETTVVITVEPIADPPLAADDAYSVDEDTVLTVTDTTGVLVNDSDADGDTLTASLVSDVAHGTLNLSSDGSFTYTPDADFHGTDTFTYLANDGSEDSQTATVTLTVTPVNDAPTAVDDTYGVDVDGTLSVNVEAGVLANDADVDGDTLTVALASDVTNGTLSLAADGSFTYTPTVGFHGTDSFSYTVSDGDLVSGPADVNITVDAIDLLQFRLEVTTVGGTPGLYGHGRRRIPGQCLCFRSARCGRCGRYLLGLPRPLVRSVPGVIECRGQFWS